MTAPTVREQLVNGVSEHIAKGGAVDLGVRALAATAGRSTMCIYSTYGSRQKLLEAVYRQLSRRWVDRLTAAANGGLEVAYAQLAAQSPDEYRFLLETGLPELGIDLALRRELIGNLLALIADSGYPEPKEAWSLWHGRAVLTKVLAVNSL